MSEQAPPITTTTNTLPPAPNASEDPFAKMRDPNDNPFAPKPTADANSTSSGSSSADGDDREPVTQPMSMADRRMSKEWDASKTPPSRFQKLPGSIFATPSSRDGHIARNKIHGFKEKVLELSGGHKREKKNSI